PYDTLEVQKPHDWFVLFAFLITATLAAQLLGHANAPASAAREAGAEIDRRAALGAETLSEGRAENALGAILRVIGDTLGVPQCAIYAVDGGEVQPAVLAASPAGPAAGAMAAGGGGAPGP